MRTCTVEAHPEIKFAYVVTFLQDGNRVERAPYSAHNMMTAIAEWLNRGTVKLAIFEG